MIRNSLRASRMQRIADADDKRFSVSNSFSYHPSLITYHLSPQL